MPDPNAVEAAVKDALQRHEEDLRLLDSVPGNDTRAGREAMTSARMAVHERFALNVRHAVGQEVDAA